MHVAFSQHWLLAGYSDHPLDNVFFNMLQAHKELSQFRVVPLNYWYILVCTLSFAGGPAICFRESNEMQWCSVNFICTVL